MNENKNTSDFKFLKLFATKLPFYIFDSHKAVPEAEYEDEDVILGF